VEFWKIIGETHVTTKRRRQSKDPVSDKLQFVAGDWTLRSGEA